MMRRSETSWNRSSPEGDRISLWLLALLLWVLVIPQCAHKEPPPGGPVDRTSPEVVSHLPKPNAVGVPLDQGIAITFSEAMDRSSVADALFISPAPREAPKIKWRGSTAKVTLADGLQPDITYVITLGVSCKDLRKNNMRESYSFAFSTGERIDQGSLLGRVYQDIAPRMGVDLWAYQLKEDFQPDPAVHNPDYVTQTDGDGNFRWDHLGHGRYRVFAVEDLNDDRKFDADLELLAVPSEDAALSEAEPTYRISSLRLARLDTVSPSLKSVEVLPGDQVVLSFDEPLDSASAVRPENYSLRSGGEQSIGVEIRAVSAECRSRDRVTLSAVSLEEGRRYLVSPSGLRDLAGNQIGPPGDQAEFLSNGLPDTTGPELVSLWPPDSALAIPRNARISLCFGEAVEPISVETSFVVRDALHEPLPGRFQWEHGAGMQFSFDQDLGGGQIYSIFLDAVGVMDLSGNGMEGASMVTWFQTVEAEILGSLSGQVVAWGVPDTATVFVRAHGLEETAGEGLVTAQGEEYRFAELPPGRYLISAFVDLDGNGRFGFGRPVPFLPAEPFAVHEDTVRIRSRWETAGVNIVFSP
jgi:uncharacterized protein (DUF2141 family)